jgi:hypothetical protein
VQKLPRAIFTTVLMGILLIGLLLLLIIPGVIAGVYWAFALSVVVFYGKSGFDALNYSKDLVKGRWWTVFSYLLGFLLISFIISVLMFIVIYIFRLGAGLIFESIAQISHINNLSFEYMYSASILNVLFSGIGSRLIETYFVIASVVLFMELDLKRKK